MNTRTVIKIAGENGMGLSSVGEIVQKALKRAGFYIRSEREFPSTIKGGRRLLPVSATTDMLLPGCPQCAYNIK